jgi:integrase
MKVKEQKTGKIMQITLSAELWQAITQHVKENRLEKGDFLIYSRRWKRDKALTRSQAWRIIRRMASEMGLESIGTHSMRKTYANELYANTGDIFAVQAALNHKHMHTTLSYLLGKGRKMVIVDE